MKPSRFILPVFGLVAVLMSFIISYIPLGVANQAQVSALYPTLFTPAAITFSIWSIIYLSWIALGVAALMGKVDVPYRSAMTLGLAQCISSLWLVPSQFLYIATSFVVMLALFVLLLCTFLYSQQANMYFRYTVQLFLGWITIATIANFHQTLVAHNMYYYPVVLTVISLIFATALFITSIKKYDTIIPSIVFIWAGAGIILGQTNPIVQITAALGCFTVIGVLIAHQNAKK